MKALEKYKLGNIELKNRLVMSPMCMYSAKDDGKANDFHFTHYETRAIGGVGLIIVEATAVMPNGRISDHDLGIWSDEQIEGLREIASRIKKHGARAGIQIAHAGRKSEATKTEPIAPSALRFSEDYRTPQTVDERQIHQVVQAFVDGAKRAVTAGFDYIEIHGAHGYLNHEFLSYVTNLREDQFGGSLQNRCRLLNWIIDQVKAAIPEHVALGLRVSASDYVVGGIDGDEMVKIIDQVKEKLDIVHTSSGGLAPVTMHVYPGYQIRFAEQIKHECQVATIAVGLITSIEMIEEVLNNNRSDLIALGRLLLRDPYFPLKMYHQSGVEEGIPKAYKRGF
ncbi:MAG: NADPH dehydrogenase NamA [Firmicutes bacterium HGW-Firmicutes-3]|jgi:NADPH2 dehydrogenase|nr:MAG: NADPH dehydrogenase NamA [Firmicutes bacterium HGW-Firmicutes-3]